jgi:hypothetical protein
MSNYYEDYEPNFEPSEFEIKVSELIKQELDNKIKETVEGLERYKALYEQQQKELYTVKGELRILKIDSEKQLLQALKEKEKEVKRELSSGFTINDIVYIVDYDRHNKKCDKCNGNYKIKIEVLGKEKQVDCPHCSSGTIYTSTAKPSKPKTISWIKFYLSRSEYKNKNCNSIITEVKLWLDESDYETTPDKVFRTLEECQKKCDELNKPK